MKLTLAQAAEKLGKSVRQVRYMIRTGRLKANKDGGRWAVDAADLPLTEGQDRARSRHKSRLRDAVEDALDLNEGDSKRERYSMTDLRAFKVARPALERAAELLDEGHPACRALRTTLDLLAVGCHRFLAEDKREAYSQARDNASLAACALHLCQQPEARDLAATVEQDLLPAVAGLLRRLDRGRRRGRAVP